MISLEISIKFLERFSAITIKCMQSHRKLDENLVGLVTCIAETYITFISRHKTKKKTKQEQNCSFYLKSFHVFLSYMKEFMKLDRKFLLKILIIKILFLGIQNSHHEHTLKV